MSKLRDCCSDSRSNLGSKLRYATTIVPYRNEGGGEVGGKGWREMQNKGEALNKTTDKLKKNQPPHAPLHSLQKSVFAWPGRDLSHPYLK